MAGAAIEGLYVEERGQGPALVLAHGFAGSARNFRPQLRALQERYHVWLYDARGHARSPAPEDPEAYSLDALVSDFAGVAARAGSDEDRPVCGGLSMGAAVALTHVLAAPERVRALLLASFPGGPGAIGSVSSGALAFAEAIETKGLDAAGAEFVWGPSSGLDPAAGKLVRQGFLEHPPHALASILRGVLAHLPAPVELAPRLATLRCPVLLVAGERDAPSLDASQCLAEALPKARLAVVPGAGHVVNLERAADFNRLFGQWLAELDELAVAADA